MSKHTYTMVLSVDGKQLRKSFTVDHGESGLVGEHKPASEWILEVVAGSTIEQELNKHLATLPTVYKHWDTFTDDEKDETLEEEEENFLDYLLPEHVEALYKQANGYRFN